MLLCLASNLQKNIVRIVQRANLVLAIEMFSANGSSRNGPNYIIRFFQSSCLSEKTSQAKIKMNGRNKFPRLWNYQSTLLSVYTWRLRIVSIVLEDIFSRLRRIQYSNHLMFSAKHQCLSSFRVTLALSKSLGTSRICWVPFLYSLEVHNFFFREEQRNLSFPSCQHDLHGSLKRCRAIPKFEWQKN